MKADQVVFITSDEILNIGANRLDRGTSVISLKENKVKSEQVVYKKTEELLNIGLEKEDREMILNSIEINSKKDFESISKQKSNTHGIAPYHVSDTKITKPLEDKPSLRKFIIDKVKGASGDSEKDKKANNKGSKESLTKE